MLRVLPFPRASRHFTYFRRLSFSRACSCYCSLSYTPHYPIVHPIVRVLILLLPTLLLQISLLLQAFLSTPLPYFTSHCACTHLLAAYPPAVAGFFLSLQIRCPSNPPSASILLHVGCSSHSHSLSSCLRCRLFRDWPIFLNVSNTLDSPPGFLAPLRNSLGSY